MLNVEIVEIEKAEETFDARFIAVYFNPSENESRTEVYEDEPSADDLGCEEGEVLVTVLKVSNEA